MGFDSVYREKQVPATLRNIWQAFRQDMMAMVGLYGVLALFLLCLVGSWIAPYALDQQFLGYQLLPPSWSQYGSVSFFLGTDDLGRDLMSRLLNGVAPTFGSALLVSLAAAVPGILFGLLAGMLPGKISSMIRFIFDLLLSVPSLLMAIIIVAFIGPSLKNAMLAVWLAILPHLVRAVYSAVRDELDKEYVVAARLDGATNRTILWEVVLPNIAPQLISELTRALSIAILDIAALGFLDLGAQIPSAEWGVMLGDSLELIYVAPWSVMLPGAAILCSVLLVNILGDGLRRATLAGYQ